MKLVKGRVKNRLDFPPQERCCDSVVDQQEAYSGMILTIDLDDSIEYGDFTGHCGQKLGYENAFLVVGTDEYIPLELVDLDEGEFIQ